MPRTEVSITEFANILGIDQSSVSKAIARGRLKKSVVIDGLKKRIIVYDGCIEWRDNKDHSKDRGNGVRVNAELGDDVMPIEVSVALERHFSALLKQLDFHRESGELISIDKYRVEAFQIARATRDAILYIPVSTSREIQGVMTRLLASYVPPEKLESAQTALEAAASDCRQLLKKALNKSLHELAAHESAAPDTEASPSDS